MPAPATLPPLTPGWCHAPTRLIDPRSLGARPLSPPIFPHDTRAGLLERLSLDPPDDSHAPDLSPLGPEDPDTSSPPDAPLDNLPAASTPAPPPFVALVEALTAPALLALARRGACGFVLRAEPDRHTLVLARALGLPLALTAPVAALALGLPASLTPLVALTALIGGAGFAFTGALGAALALGARRGGLLIAVVVLPLFIPPVVFGAGALTRAASGQSPASALALLGAYVLFALVIAPIAGAAAVRNAQG